MIIDFYSVLHSSNIFQIRGLGDHIVKKISSFCHCDFLNRELEGTAMTGHIMDKENPKIDMEFLCPVGY